MRISTSIAIFLILLNSSATFLIASGVAGDLGIAPQPGGSEQVDAVNETAKNINPGGGAGGTLFGLFVSAASSAKDIFVMVTVGGPLLLANLGVPNFVLALLFGPAYLIVGVDALYAYTGRDI